MSEKPSPHIVSLTTSTVKVMLHTSSRAQAVRLAAAINEASVLMVEVQNVEKKRELKALKEAISAINRAATRKEMK